MEAKDPALRNENHNLNHQIIALQNNPPVIIQNQGMAGYAPKKFCGLLGEDLLLWFQEFRQWVKASGIDIGTVGASGVRNRARVLGVLWKMMLEIGMRAKLRKKIGNYKTFWMVLVWLQFVSLEL